MSEADAEDNTLSCVTFVSYQQAASGAPKCTICDQVCHAIIPCTDATDDEDVLEHMTSAFAARERQRGANRKHRHLFLLTEWEESNHQEQYELNSFYNFSRAKSHNEKVQLAAS